MPIPTTIEEIHQMWQDVDDQIRRKVGNGRYSIHKIVARHMTVRDNEIYWRCELNTGSDSLPVVCQRLFTSLPDVTFQEVKQLDCKPGVTIFAIVMNMSQWPHER